MIGQTRIDINVLILHQQEKTETEMCMMKMMTKDIMEEQDRPTANINKKKHVQNEKLLYNQQRSTEQNQSKRRDKTAVCVYLLSVLCVVVRTFFFSFSLLLELQQCPLRCLLGVIMKTGWGLNQEGSQFFYFSLQEENLRKEVKGCIV